MNKIIRLVLVLIIYSGYSQNSPTNKKFKKTIETETYGVKYSDGKMHIFTSEIIETKYDNAGQEIEAITKTFYNQKPYQTSKITYFYNDQGNLIYTNTLVLEDSTQYKIQYTYLDNKLIKKNSYFILKEQENKYKEEYYYNKNNKLIKSSYMYFEKRLDSDYKSRDLIAEFKYDKNERTIESNWLKSDSTYKYNKIIHLRNKKGRIIKEKEYNKNNELIKKRSIKYSFDDYNNWVLKKVYENKACIKTTIREIEYYN